MARSKTVTLKGAAAQAFVEAKRAEMENKPRTYGEHCQAVVVAIHMDMANGDVAGAVLRLQHFAEGQRLVVTEGVESVWHYHLSNADDRTKSICGKRTMAASVALSEWKVPFGGHLPKKPTWCKDCEERRSK